jgi:predicted RNase H-like nuclease (RuvC/YqgF family)
MAVIFKSFDQIEIDGISSGNIVDVISNHGPKRLQVLDAYKTYTDNLSSDNANALSDQATKHQEAITKLNAEHATALQEVQTDLATKSSQLEATTKAKTSLDLRVATLTNEKQSLVKDLATANTTIVTLTAKVAELEQYRPYNPRILSGEAFYKRVSEQDRNTLLASENPYLQEAGLTIVRHEKNKWPVILDSGDFRRLVGYVLQSGVFDESEVVEIMRDATPKEAYRVTELA